MKKYGLSLLSMLLYMALYAQTPRNPLSRVINVPNKSHISPSLSGDGKHMVFVSNYTASEKMILKYTFLDENNQWTEPVELTNISRSELDFVGGHWLSYDGSMIFFTSKRSPNIGKYDIFFSERKGSYWTPPQNIGKPINSTENEGHPSLSPDGRFLYFMRCKDMDNYNADGCELYVAERRSENYWNEPKKLPNPINKGNEATPRIMPDGETLIFSSKRPGGKGGFDLYQSRLVNGQWTTPVACYYLNTEHDDQYVSVPAHGNLVYYSTLFRNHYTIIEAQIPDELKPKRVVLAQGHIMDAATNKPIDAVIQVYNARTKERDQFIKSKADGSFFVLIKGEDIYDFSIVSRENKHIYFSRLYDLREMAQSKIEDHFIEMKPIQDGLVFTADDIQFEPYSAVLKQESQIAMLRLVKFLKDNPGLQIEIGVHLDEMRIDSIADPELTEVWVDTVYLHPEPKDEFILDDQDEFMEFEDLEVMEEVDSVDTVDTVSQSLYRLKFSFHNDRTEKQAQAIADKLISLGVPFHLVSTKGYGDKQNLVPNISEENREKNKRVEIKLVKNQ